MQPKHGDSIFFEFRRIFFSRASLIIFGVFAFLIFFSLYSGLEEYKEAQQDKDTFLQFEKRIFERYVNYSQYGDKGFRVLLVPEALNIFLVLSHIVWVW